MIQRCTNPNTGSYADYGARGITVCSRWATSFAAFLADMGECPDGMTIERKDCNGNYEPGNCEWIPRSLQNDNRRNAVRVCGYSAKQLAEMFGVKQDTIYMRLHRNPTKFIKQVEELSHGHASTPH